MILSRLVGKKSPENPSMDIINAGSPDESYMMHKLDDDQCRFSTACNATTTTIFLGCGLGMPYGTNMVLDEPTRDNIRRWIAQGAQNN